MERNSWYTNFRELILFAAAAGDQRTLPKATRHWQRRPRGKLNTPDKRAAQ